MGEAARKELKEKFPTKIKELEEQLKVFKK